MNVVNYIHQDSGKTDYGTPMEFVDAARKAMGGVIHLDPASAPWWNKRIRALKYWHIVNVTTRWYQRPKYERPFVQSWDYYGQPSNVWMNHPYGRDNYAWIKKVVDEYKKGNVAQACVLTFAEHSTRWGALLNEFPRFYPARRIAHLDRDGRQLKQNTKGSMITYLGDIAGLYSFAAQFRKLDGTLFVPWSLWWRG